MIASRVLVAGRCQGDLLDLGEPLSFWGGVDPGTGRIIEEGHPRAGQSVGGRILVMPHGRGSSSSSSVLAELLRVGQGPAGIILGAPDSILVVGSIVARMLYGADCPLVVASLPKPFTGVWKIDGDRVEPHAGESR